MARLKVEGLKPVLKRLNKLPERARRHALRPALRKASTPVRKKARKLAPRSGNQDENRTPLNKSIVKTSVKWHRQSDTLYVVVGADYKKAPHAILVHDGTDPHEIILKEPLNLNGVWLPAGFIINHPGSRPQPFLDDAVQQTQSKVQGILRDGILQGIEKQVQKLRNSR